MSTCSRMKIGSAPHDHTDVRSCAKSRSLFPTNCFIEEMNVIAVDGELLDCFIYTCAHWF
jgi:hypothetical protein